MAADAIPEPLVQACDQVRRAEDDDAVSGVKPAFVAAPASTQQASDLLAAAAGLGLAVVPRGTGSRLHWGIPPERADLIIDMTRMDRVIEHAAGDLVASVQAGVGLGQLAGVLAGAGQRLALDPPSQGSPTSGTVGGLLATGVAGPLRLRYGSPRDLLIGITVVRADGTVAKSGGKVVKNVAGYDLGKLFAGSRGTLGLIAEATFRLHPLPAATTYITIECGAPADCGRLLAAALRAPIAPVAAELDWPAGATPVLLGVAVEGDPGGVAERAAALASQLTAIAGRDAQITQHEPEWWRGGAAADAHDTVIQIAFWPGDVGVVLTEVRAAAERAGAEAAIGGSAAAGLLFARVAQGTEPGKVAAFVADARTALGHVAAGGDAGPPSRTSVVVLHAPRPVGEIVDPYGPVPSLDLMRAIKRQFDPDRMMSPGRFVGGL